MTGFRLYTVYRVYRVHRVWDFGFIGFRVGFGV